MERMPSPVKNAMLKAAKRSTGAEEDAYPYTDHPQNSKRNRFIIATILLGVNAVCIFSLTVVLLAKCLETENNAPAISLTNAVIIAVTAIVTNWLLSILKVAWKWAVRAKRLYH